jgi:putative hydrolase of the HAD superfamily
MDKFDYGNLREYFEAAYFSCEIGLRKPNLEIFKHVIETEGLDPEETLFIDDSAQHVKGAKNAGLHAFHHIENDIADIFEEVIELFNV